MSGSLVLAFLAGVFSTLSPCVLPLLPVVLGTAVSESRYGPAALAVGLAMSFVTIGLFFALAGHSIGLDQSALRVFAGALLVLIGATLALPVLSYKFAEVASPVGNWVDSNLRLQHGRLEGSVCTWAPVGSCLEPVRGTNAWRCVRAGCSRQGLGTGCRDDGIVRHRRGITATIAGPSFARSHAQMAQQAFGRGSEWQDPAWCDPGSDRIAGAHRSR